MRLIPSASLFLVAAAACSRPGVQVTRLPGGVHELRCDHALATCLSHVDDYCKGSSYEVVQGSDEALFYGTGDSSVEGHKSFAVVRCLSRGEKPRVPKAGVAAVPEPSGAPVPVAGAPPPPPASGPPPAPATRCIPGATQACVGAAACAGGQACLPDGSGFGPCDCGTAPAPKGG